jgi:mannosyltransferase
MSTGVAEPTASASGAHGERRGEDHGGLLDLACVATPAALALILSLLDITARSLGFDEGASVTIAAQHGSALGSAIAHDGGNMSGYYVLLHGVIAVFGNGVVAVRSASVVAATVAVGALAALALRMFGRRVALMSGLICAVSLPLIFWAQAARGYAPMVALVTLSFLALVVLVQRVEQGRSRRWAWIAYVAFTALAAYTSFAAALVIPAQLVVLAFVPRARRSVLIAVASVLLCWIPLAVLALDRGSGQLFWVPGPSRNAQQVWESLSSAALRPSFASSGVTWVLLAVTSLLVLCAAVAILRALAHDRRDWRGALMLAWLIVPLLLAWLESLLAQPIFISRNLLVAEPAVAVLVALALTHRRVPQMLGWALLAGVLALRAAVLVPAYGVSPEQWKGATSFVLARAQAGDCIAFYPSDGRMAFRYYLGDRPAPRSVLPVASWGAVRPFVEDYATLSPAAVSAVVRGCPRLWFVTSHEGQPSGPAGSRANYTRYLGLRSALEDAYAIRRVTSLGRAAVIRIELLGSATGAASSR